MGQKVKEENGISLKDLLHIFRKNLILLLVIIVISTFAGVVYSRMQQPNYTAHETVFFRAQNIDSNNTTDNISAMLLYVDTVTDFCDEGVVIDRANYHYTEYLQKKSEGDVQNVEDYVAWVTSATKNNTYDREKIVPEYFAKGNISIIKPEKSDDGKKPFSFTVSYTDDYSGVASDKVQILVLSLKLESKEVNSNQERKYFYGVNIEIEDAGLTGISTNVSAKKTIILFFVLGLALGVIAVFVINFLDNTIKTKEELEHITGVSNLVVLEYQGGDRK